MFGIGIGGMAQPKTPFQKNSPIFLGAKHALQNHRAMPAAWRRNVEAFLFKLAKQVRSRERWLWAIFSLQNFCTRAPFKYFRKVLLDDSLDGTQIIEGGPLCPSRARFVAGKVNSWIDRKKKTDPLNFWEGRFHYKKGIEQEEKVIRQFRKGKKVERILNVGLDADLAKIVSDYDVKAAEADREERRRRTRVEAHTLENPEWTRKV